MSIEKDDYPQAVEAAPSLTLEQQQKLLEELTHRIEAVVTPLPLMGTWEGVSLTAEEIDDARRQCWANLGKESRDA